MYQYSRAIYRQLAPRIDAGRAEPTLARRQLLAASEATIQRLASDGRYFAHPARALFTDIREHFGLADQGEVYAIVDRHINLASDFIESLPGHLRADGTPRSCAASTRKGTPCRRQPRPGREYCPSHRHLEELAGPDSAREHEMSLAS